MRRLRGFTLIEIAMVLFVGALILGGVVQYLALQVATAKVTATKAKQDAIKGALVNYIVRNNQLPCPADPALPTGDPLNGIAKSAGVCTGGGVATTAAVAQGMIPWATLGLSNETSLDGYGNRFTYQVVIAATNLQANPGAGQQSVSGMKGAITLHSAGPAVVAPTAGANQLNNCTPGAPTDNPCLAVVVVVSHGLDGFGAYTDGGVQIAFPATVTGSNARENANKDSAFVTRAFSGSDTDPYDDIVLALTPNDLLSPLTSGGGLQDFRSVLNSNFTVIKNAIIASVTRTGAFLCVTGTCSPTANCHGPGTTCEVTQFTYTLPTAGSPDTLNTTLSGGALPAVVKNDPWGNSIQYIVGTSPIAPATASSNNAFTLQSFGPNGVDNACAAGTDDLCINVSVGEFQGLATKFR